MSTIWNSKNQKSILLILVQIIDHTIFNATTLLYLYIYLSKRVHLRKEPVIRGEIIYLEIIHWVKNEVTNVQAALFVCLSVCLSDV